MDIDTDPSDTIRNIRRLETQDLVESIREATTGHEVDAEGQRLSPDLLTELLYEVRKAGHVSEDDVLYLLHPAQMEILRTPPDLHHEAEVPAFDDGAYTYLGIDMLVDSLLPPAVVYLVDPNAITVGGQVLYQHRIGRLTGLAHPDADTEK